MTTAALADRPAAVMPDKAPSILVLIGPPGCGKGTQSNFISGALGIPSISTGEILRHAAAQDGDLGGRVRRLMEAGALVSDDIVNHVVANRIGDDDCAAGFILDGYPRTVEQARHMDEMLRNNSLPEAQIVIFDVQPDLLVRRLAARRYCPFCGRVYNLVSAPPAEEEFCDDDGMFLVKRTDDDENVIRERLVAYERATAPLIRHYAGSVCHRIDAAGEIEAVASQIQAALSA
jgi:adenylate kinase